MMSSRLYLVFVMTATFSVDVNSNSCTAPGWFGSTGCRFMCHCTGNSCNIYTGACSSGCSSGWFGPACQYVSTATDLSWLNEDSICYNNSNEEITMKLNRPHPLTWIRVTVKDPKRLEQFQLEYKEKNEQRFTPCTDARTATVDDKTLDISCPTDGPVDKIRLTGPGVSVMCSLHVSGGRNVALKQKAQQSSNFDNTYWVASNAVDGYIGVPDSESSLKSTCTHTHSGFSKRNTWSLTFAHPVLMNRIIITNRRNPKRWECCEDRLAGFFLEAYTNSTSVAFNYTAPGPPGEDFYFIDTPIVATDKAIEWMKVSVGTDYTVKSNILSLCEVEVFGEIVCPKGYFGLECEKKCNCMNDEACFVSSGGCPSGCKSGYIGADCWTACPVGRYGFDCAETCSEHCYGQGCDITDGVCKQGCKPGYRLPLCKEECADTAYGRNCSQNCSSTCLGSRCNRFSGECDGCEPGYMEDFCQKECPTYTFGHNCSSDCNTFCLDQLCNHVTGVCFNCTESRTGDFCQNEITSSRQSGGEINDAAVGVLLGVILVMIIVVAILVIVIWRRRSRYIASDLKNSSLDNRNDHGVQMDSLGSLSCTSDTRSPELPSGAKAAASGSAQETVPGTVYSNALPDNTVIPVAELREYVHQNALGALLKDQFASVPLTNIYSRSYGLMPQNNKKNRYKNILPYDHSRVLLDINPNKNHGDYINASFIKNRNQDGDSYIAAQAPNDFMLNDFVRLLWEHRVDKLVMLTNPVEGRKTKCTKYWVDHGIGTFGEFEMETISTQMYAEFTIRHLNISKKNESASRSITQFHYTAWPDKSVPDSPWGLVDFHQRVEATSGGGPLLVHCSAGVGRTGTFIALCQLLHEAQETGAVNFLGTLWRLRQDRMMMIQTIDQYIFLHHAVLIGHTVADTKIEVKHLGARIQAKETSDRNTGTSDYKQEFETLTEICVDESHDASTVAEEQDNIYQNSRTAVNKQKNRLGNILPKDLYRPELACELKTLGKYINAVLVPSLTQARHEILTQLPLPTTVTDFWRLVTQYSVGLIVAFLPDVNTDETIGQFLPKSDNEPIKGVLFEIQTKAKTETHEWREMSVTVFKKMRSVLGGAAEQHNLTCLLCTDTKTEPELFLKLMHKIRSCKPVHSFRTLYTCRSGAELCGLACVQSILLDKMEIDHSFSVPLVVGAIKAIRPQVIPTEDHYRCLYQVLRLAHEASVNTCNVYGNMLSSSLDESNIPSTSDELVASPGPSPSQETSSQHSEDKTSSGNIKRTELGAQPQETRNTLYSEDPNDASSEHEDANPLRLLGSQKSLSKTPISGSSNKDSQDMSVQSDMHDGIVEEHNTMAHAIEKEEERNVYANV